MTLQWISGLHRAAQCGVRFRLHSVPLGCSSCHLEYMQVLDWLSEKDYFEAIDRVWHVLDLGSQSANVAVHHLSM